MKGEERRQGETVKIIRVAKRTKISGRTGIVRLLNMDDIRTTTEE
jgi:hypothetical protein